MQKLTYFLFIVSLFSACKKEELSSTPVVSFISLTPDSWNRNNTDKIGPNLTFQLKDAEGDFSSDDSVYVTTMFTGQIIDSLGNCNPIDTSLTKGFVFPEISNAIQNMDVEVTVNINKLIPFIRGYHCYSDTLNFQFYVKDRAGHQSNTEKTAAFYYLVP